MSAAAQVFHATELAYKQPETLGSVLGGIPRGKLTEIAGPVSSGRTSLLLSLLSAATAEDEFCALIDAANTFDPQSAQAAGVRLSQVLWIRCGGSAEHALKAADLLAHAGGFGLVAVDLADTPTSVSRRIPLAAWFRLRNSVKDTRTTLVSMGSSFHASSCPALKIDLGRKRLIWRGSEPARLLEGFESNVTCIQNHRPAHKSLMIAR